MRRIIIFSQAPGDVKYVISMCESFSQENVSVIICAIGLVQAEIFKSLGFFAPQVRVVEVGQKPKSLLNLIIERLYLERFLKQLPLGRDSELIFFSNYFDYYTFFLIHRMSQAYHIKYMDIYDVERPGAIGLSVASYFKLRVLRCLFTKHLEYTCSGETLVPTFQFEKLGIEKVAPVCIEALTYHYPMPDVSGEHSVLLFDSGFEPGVAPEAYERCVKDLIGILSVAGLQVYVKPHPTFGALNYDGVQGVNILSKYIPGELIDVKKCSFVLGFSSSALSTIAASSRDVPVVSLIELLDYSDVTRRDHYIDFLRRNSDDKVLIIESENDFHELLAQVAQ